MSLTNGSLVPSREPSLESERGFATILMLSLSPLLLALLLGFWSFCQLLSLKQDFDDLCRSSILSIQSQNSLPLHQLMRLNPQAESLIRQKKRAYKRLALGIATKNPLIIAKAKAKIAELSLRQLRLAQAQQALKLRARGMSLSETYRFQQTFWTKLKEKQKSHGLFLRIQFDHLSLPKHRWAVRTTEATELASPYKHRLNFADAQTMRASWKLRVKPKPLRLMLSESFIKMEGRCQSTLLRAKKYPSILVEDRS